MRMIGGIRSEWRCSWVEGRSGVAGLGWTQSVSSFHSRGCHFILVSGLGLGVP